MVLIRPKPNPPEVTNDEALVLAYLKKKGICDLEEVRQYCFCYNINVDLESFQKDMGNGRIIIYRTNVTASKHAIKVIDRGWADSWAIYYDEEIPHHRQNKPIKKFRVTQN